MAHRRSFHSSCDILELEEEELSSSEHYKGSNHHPNSDRRSLASNSGRNCSLEDDLNQLFEIFNRESSSQNMIHSPRNVAGPSKKKSSKKQAKAVNSPSHEFRASERTSLKQAFRGLCISQASQMASVKRSAKSGGSSKAGQIMTLYKNVAVDDSSSMASQYEGKDGLAEVERVIESYESLSTEKITLPVYSAEGLTAEEPEFEVEGPSSLVENSQDEVIYSLSALSSPIPDDNLLRTAKCSPFETPMFSSSSGCASRESLTELSQKDEHGPPPFPPHPSDVTSLQWSEPMQICPTPYKPVNKGSASKAEDKASSARAKKPTKSVSRLVKPVIKTRNFVKRKAKKDTASAHSPNDTRSEFNNVLFPGSNHIVCPRCHCVLNDEWEEVEEDSPSAELSPAMSPTMQLSPLSAVLNPYVESPDNVFSDISTPTFIPNNTKAVKEREVSENITQSLVSGPDECSNSTSISQENNLGRASSWDRPHMSKDARWQAIRQIRMQHGSLGLRNFNLLKKLGCGDIGTVYLAELIDTSCLFAIKVMDNEFLARRKKITRAQTEREILRMLDHPFLPTLFCQFTSDNLSCLVMEYCPGGDLHVLRQMQPGRCFNEQATRFYVAEVLLALEYLHMLGVIYRDLKPENILVREDGHIMLSDFDLSLRCAVNPMLLVSPSTSATSKSASGPNKNSSCVGPFCIQPPSYQVSCFGPKILRRANKSRKTKPDQPDFLKPLLQLVAEPTDARSNSFVGTHEYLAPEIIKGEGHGSSVDWWTLGVFLFELLYGKTPFRGSGNEETLANVVLQSLKFPDSPLVSLHARDLIVGLLAKDPEGRLGSERGAAEIKQHPFFEGLNWALIRCAVPPDLPEFHWSNGVGNGSVGEKVANGNNGNNSKYLEYNSSTGEHLEFEVF
ncbi:hypothetical protein V2J09_006587 [Rumex salicifolius]